MVINVRVQPRARGNDVEVVEGRTLRVRVTASPEGGKANRAVIALLARRLGVPKSSVVITRGHRSRDKLVRVEGLSLDEALARLTTS